MLADGLMQKCGIKKLAAVNFRNLPGASPR